MSLLAAWLGALAILADEEEDNDEVEDGKASPDEDDHALSLREEGQGDEAPDGDEDDQDEDGSRDGRRQFPTVHGAAP